MTLPVRRILIIKPSSLGDVVHTLPVAHALRRCLPQARITWVVQESLAALVENDPAVDQVFRVRIPSTSDPHAGPGRYPRALAGSVRALLDLRSLLRGQPHDLVLDLHASWRSGLMALCNPGGRRIGFAHAREGNTLCMHERVRVPGTVEHAVEQNLLFCEHLGCQPREEDFLLDPGARAWRQARDYAASRLPADRPLIYCNPAARWASKHWPVGHWSALVDAMQARGWTPLLAGSRADRPLLEEIAARCASSPPLLAGDLDLAAVGALLHLAGAYVGLDSGPMHMAAMCGTPVVALFGPTHPERCGPYPRPRAAHQVLRAPLDCLGCRRRACARPRCMEEISPEEVLKATARALRSGTGRKESC